MRRNARGWLLWLALLLPIAQAMAGVHALSHALERADDAALHLVHCDLCLTAADLGSGAPAAAPGPLPASAAVDARSVALRDRTVACDATWRPPARAPPVSA